MNMAVIELNDENYQQVLADTSKPVVVDFWATWCGPCRMVSPIIDQLAEEYNDKVVICKCNVDDSTDLPSQYGIRNIPTVLFFKNGELVDKQVGSAPKPAFVTKIEALLK